MRRMCPENREPLPVRGVPAVVLPLLEGEPKLFVLLYCVQNLDQLLPTAFPPMTLQIPRLKLDEHGCRHAKFMIIFCILYVYVQAHLVGIDAEQLEPNADINSSYPVCCLCHEHDSLRHRHRRDPRVPPQHDPNNRSAWGRRRGLRR